MGSTTDLDRAPALLPLYARAALPRPGGDAVPGDALRLRAVRPGVDHVADYARLCGFSLRSTLPVTYPHLLGFPLQLALMADRRFPFPATGLVHVANEVRARRPIPVGAALDVTVRAAGPAPHRRGRTVDLLTDVAIDGETVWTSTSTYLRRGPGTGSAAAASLDVPPDLPTTAVWRLPADLGRRYAAVSGDRNPIHLWPLTARLLGFRRPIAHGMWTAAACLAALGGRVGADVLATVEFKAPVVLPSTVELATRVEGEGVAEAVVRSCSGRAHLLARVTSGRGAR